MRFCFQLFHKRILTNVANVYYHDKLQYTQKLAFSM